MPLRLFAFRIRCLPLGESFIVEFVSLHIHGCYKFRLNYILCHLDKIAIVIQATFSQLPLDH